MVGEGRENLADVRALQIGPVTLGFDAEYQSIVLPAIPRVSTGAGARSIVTTFRSDSEAGRGEVPAVVARSPTGVDAGVKAAPVVERNNVRRRPGVGLRRNIRRESGSGHAQGHPTHRTQQKLLHHKNSSTLPSFIFALSRAKTSQARPIEAGPPKGGQIPAANIIDSGRKAVSQMQHWATECMRQG